MPRPNMVRLRMNHAAASTTTKTMNAVGMREVRPDSGLVATNSAERPKLAMPSGMTASWRDSSVPCIKPLKTLEEPRVTIIAGRPK